jgi:hypothetical protein
MGTAIACTVDTCPSGSVCCASAGMGHLIGTQCQQGACGGGEHQLCNMTTPCPSGERCIMFGGGEGYCAVPRDGGPSPRDAAAD